MQYFLLFTRFRFSLLYLFCLFHFVHRTRCAPITHKNPLWVSLSERSSSNRTSTYSTSIDFIIMKFAVWSDVICSRYHGKSSLETLIRMWTLRAWWLSYKGPMLVESVYTRMPQVPCCLCQIWKYIISLLSKRKSGRWCYAKHIASVSQHDYTLGKWDVKHDPL